MCSAQQEALPTTDGASFCEWAGEAGAAVCGAAQQAAQGGSGMLQHNQQACKQAGRQHRYSRGRLQPNQCQPIIANGRQQQEQEQVAHPPTWET